MNVAICTIATGEYCNNLDELFLSINKYFLENHKKTIFLFTDLYKYDGVIVKHIENLPWPLITLLRFKYITEAEKEIEKFDCIYYIDSDCTVVDNITEGILPSKKGQLVAVEHPWQGCNSDIYETNPLSMACVLDNKGTHYFQACFFGGYSDDFLKMSKHIYENIKQDLENNIIAKWHDESHLNKYFIENLPKSLHVGYAYPNPDIWNQTFSVEKKIIHNNKKSS